MKQILLIMRADVAQDVRAAISTEWGINATDWFAVRRYRRASGTPGQRTHFAAHGDIPISKFPTLRTILAQGTQGVRDSVDWQGRDQGVALADASWAIAYDGADIVAGYRLTRADATRYTKPTQVLEALGLVSIKQDAEEFPQ